MRHNLVSAACPLWVDKIFKQLCSKKFSNGYICLLVALSGSFFGLAWCSFWFGSLLFIAIVPILLIIKLLAMRAKRKSFMHCLFYMFLTIFLWNTLTIWWISNADLVGFLFIACCNALYLSLPWLFYYYMRKWAGVYVGYAALVTGWLTLEYAHFAWEFWELSFPWLNLGNGLAALPYWVQWYSYTGILGGSLWILVINILIYHLLFENTTPLLVNGFLCWLLVPILISLMMYYNHREQGMAVEAVVVQPNIDTYTEKDASSSAFVPHAHQIDRLLTLSKEQLTPATCLVVWPESALSFWVEEKVVHNYVLLQPILQWLEQLPELSLITGASSLCSYGAIKATQTARKIGGGYVDHFNSVFHLKAGNKLDIYHKEKRLPFGEYIPYCHVLPERISFWIRQKFMELGNIDPCFGQGSGSKVFEISPQIKVAAINCYDSLYGAFVGSAVQKGANLLTITTNDNWWGDTPIYHHHFQYSRLLAIAHRKSVIRSANTGISGFINQRGDAIAETNRLVPAALRQVVYANNQMTFYSLYGDYIGHIAAWACLLLFFILLIARLKYKDKCLPCFTICFFIFGCCYF